MQNSDKMLLSYANVPKKVNYVNFPVRRSHSLSHKTNNRNTQRCHDGHLDLRKCNSNRRIAEDIRKKFPADPITQKATIPSIHHLSETPNANACFQSNGNQNLVKIHEKRNANDYETIYPSLNVSNSPYSPQKTKGQ